MSLAALWFSHAIHNETGLDFWLSIFLALLQVGQVVADKWRDGLVRDYWLRRLGRQA